MTDERHINGWPAPFARMATVSQIHALGQITLAYNFLEDTFENIFQEMLPTKAEFSKRFFHALNNRNRIDLVKALISESAYDDAKDAITHFVKAFDILTEDRNIIMHSVGFSNEANIIELLKKTSHNPTKLAQFAVPDSDLRKIADQMVDYVVYGERLKSWLQIKKKPETTGMNTLQLLSLGTQDQIEKAKAVLSTLPEKPLPPHKLTPYRPPEDQTGASPPPRSSRW